MAKKDSDAPQPEGTAVTSSTNTPESSDQGGGGTMDAASAEAIIAAGKSASVEQLGEVADFLAAEEGKFRKAFPCLSKAIDAWRETNAAQPRAVRVVSSVEGFRRAGISHGREAADHSVEAFKRPEDLEALFAEPRLAVTFI